MLPSRTLAHVQRRRRWTATLAVALLFSLAALPGRVNAQTAPDLIIRGLSLSTSVVREGDVVTAVVTVWNYGRGPANPFSIGLHVAARRDAPVDGTTELGRLAVGTLAAGASAQRSLTFKVPAVAPGTFYVIAQADVAEVVAETSDRNNRRSAALYVVLPDLVVDSLTVTPNTAAAGDTVTVRARVRNLGRVSANATEGALHFATSPTSLDGETLQSTFPVPELAAGASEQLTLSLVVPPVAPGSFYVVARADGADGIEERSESNNQRWAVLRVATANLTINRFTATPSTVLAESTIHGVVSLQNRALVSSAPTTASLYIAPNPDADLATLLPTATTSVPAMGPLRLTTLNVPVTVPARSQGTQYLIVQIGAGSPGPSLLAARASFTAASAPASVGPRGSTPFTVGYPDLVVSRLFASPAQIPLGGSVIATLTVRNQGDVAAPNSIVGLNLVPSGSPVASGQAPLSTVSVDALAPRAYATVTATVPVTGVGPGGYSLVAEANWSRAVPESRDDNNQAIAALQVTGPSGPGTPGPGTPVDLEPLVDPSQLDMPWPKHSHYKQPWKAWLETLPAQAFLDGLGIYYNWNVDRASHDVQLRLLAAAGFSRIRVEVGWNNIDYDTLALKPAARAKLAAIAAAARAHGIRPLILLNAEHGWPVPVKALSRTLATPAPAGARSLLLSDVSALLPHFTGLSFLAGGKMADILITAVDPTTRRVSLSKPLPLALPAGHALDLHTLRYRPLAEPGSPDFEATVAGWLSYTRTVLTVLADAGLPAFDVEIWNELTFGSDFLRLNAYYTPPVVTEGNYYLEPGGRVWELARRTVDMLRAEFPQAVPIWGLSNTTFFGVPIRDLPPGTRGQTYHPYFFIDYRSIEDEQIGFQENLEGFAPAAPPYRALMPEGAGMYLKTESLARLLNPGERHVRPPDSPSFDHYMTEYGFNPPEFGAENEAQGQIAKAKTLLRGSMFWLNKGLKALWFFADIHGDVGAYDLLPDWAADLGAYPANPDSVLTLPLRALRNATAMFEGATPISSVRQLSLEAAAADGDGGGLIFAGDYAHPSLTYQDALAAFPFQVDARTFVIGLYVMSRNILQELPLTQFVLKISNVNGTSAQVRYADPLTGLDRSVDVLERSASSIVVALPVSDSPGLLEIRE